MGRVRPAYIKRVAKELLERYPDEFSSDFRKNRSMLDKLDIIQSKTVKNRVAGYIASSKKKTH